MRGAIKTIRGKSAEGGIDLDGELAWLWKAAVAEAVGDLNEGL